MCIDAKSDGIKIMILSLSLVALSTLLHYNIGLNLTNEGYLWYGSVQTLAGKVPMRDFRSYDPGRYYWCAGWMKLLGEGIISLRISNAIFQTIGLTLGLLAIRRVIRSWLLMVVAGSILLMWMTPRYKVIDSSLAMAGVFFAVRLLEKPSSRRFLISGIFVGLAGFLGRNHGLYNFLAFLTLILFIRYKLEKVDLLKSAFVWFIGILIGYSPMLIMMLTISGLFESFLYPFGKMLRLGSTNLPIPVPWPWVPDYSKMNFMQIGRSVSIGILFLLLPIFYAVSALFLWIRFEKRWILKTPLLPAAVFVGIFYMHYAFARADYEHLAHGIPPFLIGFLTLSQVLQSKIKWSEYGIVALLFLTIFSVGIVGPFFQKAVSKPGSFVRCDINGDSLWLNRNMATYIKAVQDIESQRIAPGEGLLIVPWESGLYPILQRESPIWDIYLLTPEAEGKQNEMIDQLEQNNVKWILLHNSPLDGRDERRLSHTHKILWDYFYKNYDPVECPDLMPYMKLLHRKTNKDSF